MLIFDQKRDQLTSLIYKELLKRDITFWQECGQKFMGEIEMAPKDEKLECLFIILFNWFPFYIAIVFSIFLKMEFTCLVMFAINYHGMKVNSVLDYSRNTNLNVLKTLISFKWWCIICFPNFSNLID